MCGKWQLLLCRGADEVHGAKGENAFRLFAASGYVREERQKRALVLSGREKNGGQVVGTEITFEGTHVLVISFLVPRPKVREEWKISFFLFPY